MEKKILKILIFVMCIIGIVGLFLPYESSIGEYRKYLEKNNEVINIREIGFTNGDVVDISLIENFKMYSYTINSSYSYEAYDVSLFNIIPTITLIISIVLISVFVILNKKIPIIICNIILLASSLLLNYSTTSREIIPSNTYTYGISYYIYIAIFLVIMVSTIYILIIDRKNNK